MSLDSLLEKLQAATEGSRELDAEIYAVIMEEAAWSVRAPMPRELGRVPHYTTSLDAALLLVPEGAVWAVSCDDDYPGLYRATVMPNIAFTVHAATPALALSAASLRALAAMEETD